MDNYCYRSRTFFPSNFLFPSVKLKAFLLSCSLNSSVCKVGAHMFNNLAYCLYIHILFIFQYCPFLHFSCLPKFQTSHFLPATVTYFNQFILAYSQSSPSVSTKFPFCYPVSPPSSNTSNLLNISPEPHQPVSTPSIPICQPATAVSINVTSYAFYKISTLRFVVK